MSKSLIQTANSSQQTVALNSVIDLGSVLRRFGCNLRMNGDTIEVIGDGYYIVEVCVTATPTAIGNVTIQLLQNDIVVPGTTTTGSVATVGNSTSLPIVSTIRVGCNCEGATSLKVVLTEGAGVINNISVRVIKV